MVLAIATPALADEATDQAKMLFSAGAAAYEKRDYNMAIQAFDAAQRLAPRPAIVFSLAQAHRRQYYAAGKADELKAAVDGFREYIKEVPSGGRHEDAMQALQELGANADRGHEQDVASVSINSSGTRGAHIIVDGGMPSEPPLIGPLATGAHRVVIAADGYVTETRDITAVAGKMVALDVPLKEKPAHVVLNAPGGAKVDMDGRPMGDTPLSAPIETTPGAHLLSVTKNGHDAFIREIELGRGEDRRLDAPLPSSRQRKIALAMIGTAAVAGVTSAAFLSVMIVEQAQANQLVNLQATRALTKDEAASYTDLRQTRNDWAVVTGATFVGAAALGVVGLLLYAFDPPSTSSAHHDMDQPKPKTTPEHKEPTELAIAPIVTPSTLGVSALLKF
ncbi:MAG TPA: PEGA domain-containing protein [Polyangiaceae bacterium]|nr:PEGA domain-containing protein [Polyangiaceae bacterium]